MDILSVINKIDIGIFALIILMVLFAASVKSQAGSLIQRRLFRLLLITNMLMMSIDSLSWLFDASTGAPAALRLVNLISNVVLFGPAPIPAALWFLYAHYMIFHDVRRLMRAARILLIPIAVNLVLVLLTIRHGWYFWIDSQNYYVRGPLFPLHTAIAYSFPIAAILMTLIYRRHLEKRHFWALLLFALPQLTGASLQIVFFGCSMTWPSMAISILIVYLYIQDNGLNTDNLTGVYNRRRFEQIIGNRIRRARNDQSFAVIFCDMDNFKQINDRFGHKAGDEALQIIPQVLRGVLRKDDLVARFGGDEFYLLLELHEEKALQNTIQRIYRAFEQYNLNSRLPFLLELSMGGAIYDVSKHWNADQFLHEIDLLMYQEKDRRRLAAPAVSAKSGD